MVHKFSQIMQRSAENYLLFVLTRCIKILLKSCSKRKNMLEKTNLEKVEICFLFIEFVNPFLKDTLGWEAADTKCIQLFHLNPTQKYNFSLFT